MNTFMIAHSNGTQLGTGDSCVDRSAWTPVVQGLWRTRVIERTNLPAWSIGGEQQQTQDVYPMLVSCWSCVADGGPTGDQHRMNVLCLLEAEDKSAYTSLVSK